jgi:predicted PurR-regulated permease PerM
MGIINFLISFPVCYFLLVDGSGLKWAVMAFLPTEKAGTYEKYLIRIDRVISGVYMGSIYTAIAGGLTSAVIFYLFGVPRPLALASIVSLAGMVPFLTWLVFIPTAIFRYYTIGPLDAVLFFLAGSTLVHLAELLIRPYLVSAASSIHPLLVLISFMGGGMVAGMAGFFLAPALVGVIVGAYQVMAEEAELRRRSGLCSEPEEDGLGEEPGDASRVEGIDNAAKDDAAKIQQG